MPTGAAHFPNALVGPLPSGLKEFNQRPGHVFTLVLGRIEACLTALKESVGYLSEDIQLKLLVGCVAGPYRCGFLVS